MSNQEQDPRLRMRQAAIAATAAATGLVLAACGGGDKVVTAAAGAPEKASKTVTAPEKPLQTVEPNACQHLQTIDVKITPDLAKQLQECANIQQNGKIALVPFGDLSPEVAAQIGLDASEILAKASDGQIRIRFTVIKAPEATLEAARAEVAADRQKPKPAHLLLSNTVAKLMRKQLKAEHIDIVVALDSQSEAVKAGEKPVGAVNAEDLAARFIDVYRAKDKAKKQIIYKVAGGKLVVSAASKDLAHEVGHTLGLGHSNVSRRADGKDLFDSVNGSRKNAQIDVLVAIGQAEFAEYGKSGALMGSSDGSNKAPMLDPVQQEIVSQRSSDESKLAPVVLDANATRTVNAHDVKGGTTVSLRLAEPITPADAGSVSTNARESYMKAQEYPTLALVPWVEAGSISAWTVNLVSANGDTWQLGNLYDVRKVTLVVGLNKITLTEKSGVWKVATEETMPELAPLGQVDAA